MKASDVVQLSESSQQAPQPRTRLRSSWLLPVVTQPQITSDMREKALPCLLSHQRNRTVLRNGRTERYMLKVLSHIRVSTGVY